MLELDTHRILDRSAKKLKLSNGEYVSAAIAYFAQTGLDPTKDQPVSLAGVSMKVDAVEGAIRAHNHEIGTRLVQIIRTWEKNLYAFLQEQQATTYGYMQLIETNILQHQVTVETNLLAPMVEQLFKVNLEAYIGRRLSAKALLKLEGKPAEGYGAQELEFNGQRDQQLVLLMREFLKTNPVPLPKPTPRRAVTPVPARPVAAASPAPASPAKS